eukprot:1162833-Ditylum_brightwellii.AAC.1
MATLKVGDDILVLGLLVVCFGLGDGLGLGVGLGEGLGVCLGACLMFLGVARCWYEFVTYLWIKIE